MTQISLQKDAVLSRISAILDNLIPNNTVYENLDKGELMAIFSQLLEKVSPEIIIALDDEHLTKRVQGVIASQLMFHLLDDMTPEEVAMFNDAVEGR